MQKAQSALEYMILVAIIAGALVTMAVYIKRGMQGGWRRAVDELGEQYDAVNTEENSILSLTSQQTSNIVLDGSIAECEAEGCYTNRVESYNTYTSTDTAAFINGY